MYYEYTCKEENMQFKSVNILVNKEGAYLRRGTQGS